jgi:HAD superfamily hydrolase (TIGR01509 family)
VTRHRGVRAVLCDLDDTLFDHRGATRDALARLRLDVPAFDCWSLDEFDARHRVILEALHLDVLNGLRSIDDARRERFARLLLAAGADGSPDQHQMASAAYRRVYQAAWRPVAGALALAAAIKSAGVSLVIITNNLSAEQRLKLAWCGFDPYVDALVTSEDVGVSKPRPEIFDAALARVDVDRTEAIVFGDAWETDIAGARAAGLRAVWFNRHGAQSEDASVPMVGSLEPTDQILRLLGVCPTRV